MHQMSSKSLVLDILNGAKLGGCWKTKNNMGMEQEYADWKYDKKSYLTVFCYKRKSK